MNMKLVDHRKTIYDFVGKLLGRELTAEEHESLKVLLTGMYKEATDTLTASNQKLNKKLKPMGKSLWNLLFKKGVPAEELKFLRDALELTDEDLAPKEKKAPEEKQHD